MRKMMRQFLGLVLALVMVIGQFTSATVVSAEEQSSETAELKVLDATFEGDLWNDGIWTVTPETWDNTDFKYFTYADDEWMKPGTNQGTTAFKYWSQGAQTITLLQKVDIPAGTYQVASDFMGEKGSVQVVFGGQQGAAVALNGYNAWVETNDTFVVEEALTDVTIGFKMTVEADGYGYIDSIDVVKVVEDEDNSENTDNNEDSEKTESAELKLEVLDSTFEGSLWDDKIWTVAPTTWTGAEFSYFTYADDEWMTPGANQGTTAFKFYVASGQEVTVLQTVDIPAGTYKVVSDFMGEKGNIQVVFGGQQGTAVALNGYNAWVETGDTFTVSEDMKDTTIGFKLALEDGAYGYIDSITVTEVDSSSDDEEKDEEKEDETVTYAIEVTADAAMVKAGETVTLNAKVTKNGVEITDLAAEGLCLWFWTDIWSNGTTDGLNDAVYVKDENGLSFTAEATLPSVGNYYIAANIEDADKTTIAKDIVAITATDPNAYMASDDNYTVVVTVDNLAPEAGDTVKMSAKITKADGTEVTDFESAGVSLWWWTDIWMSGHESGLTDAVYTNYDDNSGKSFTADVTLPSVGTYYIIGQLEYNGTKLPVVIPMTTTKQEEDTSVTGEISVEKISNLPEDFIMGMDISSVISQFASGVTYKDFAGNKIDNITDFCKLLAANGITHIRVRVWNNPFDSNGNGYGGGNCDVATAAEIAKGCRAAGLKMLIDFHCSDLWADPGKQQAPKAWAGYSVSEKATAVEEFIGSALQTIDPNHETIDMVQVGNETTGGFVGVYNTADMCTLFSAGAKAVHEYNEDVKVVIHVTNPEKGNVTKWAANLNTYAVDYDVLATSYYPYWHGTLANLESQLKTVKDTYGKDVMVAETSYAYTLADSDGHANTVREGNNDSGENTLQPFSVQGQATAIRNVMETVNNAGGLGVFYWESAWITVGDITGLSGNALEKQIAANQIKWETYGSGWASSYAAEYDAEDAGKWYGGSAVDNEAMFYPDGTPTAALYVWNYVKTGAVSKYITVEEIEKPEEKIDSNGQYTLPETVTVTYNKGEVEESVTWKDADVKKINTAVPGTYKVNGTVVFSKEINSGAYAGEKTAAVVYTLTVKQPNLITDASAAGFESKGAYTIGGKGISAIPAPDDPYSGSGSMHWYNSSATTGTVTYNEILTLEAGKYGAEIKTQGYAGDTVTLQILDATEEVLFEGDATVLEGWAVWKTASIQFELTETTEVKLRVSVGIQDGGWGTADELYLYKETVVKKPTSKPSVSGGNNDEEVETSEETTIITTPEVKLDLTLEVKPEVEKHVTEEVVEKDGKNIRVLLSVEMEGVEIAGEEHVIPVGVDFEIKHVEKDTKEYKKAETAVKEQIEVAETFTVFEMNMVSEEGVQIHALDDFIKVTVPVPETLVVGESQQLVVYRVETDGSLTKCDTIVENGMVIFTTNHFSTYVFVLEGNKTASEPANSQAEKEETGNIQEEIVATAGAGEDVPMWPVFIATIVFLAFVGLYVYAKQRKMMK